MIEPKEKIMMLDCETTGTIEDPLVYDVGFEIFDADGGNFEKASFINQDIFEDAELMKDAYFADKIPQYREQIAKGESILLPWCMIKWKIYDVCKKYNIKVVAAHNARFDSKSLNYTQRYITTSQWRYFLPFGCEWWDTLKMAREIFAHDKKYRDFCVQNNYLTARNQNKYTAEVIYRFLTGNNDFEEEHKGLDDVKIEKEIFRHCFAKNPQIDGRLYEKDYEPPKAGWHKKWWATGA